MMKDVVKYVKIEPVEGLKNVEQEIKKEENRKNKKMEVKWEKVDEGNEKMK